MSPERVLRNGLPVWWAEAPTPFQMALHVRVGHADEPLHMSGVTHLVEHLVMSEAGRREHPHNAFVDATQCVFYAEGERDEVLEYLALVGTAMATLGLGRLEHERRVLRVEAEQREPSLLSRMLTARFGITGYGQTGDNEFGLRWVGEDEVRAWWARHFTRANAALWLTGEPPEDLGFTLPDGERVPPPTPAPLPIELPGFMADGTGGVVLSGLTPRSAEMTLAERIATERLYERLRLQHGVAYAPFSGYMRLGRDTAHVMLGSDGRDDDAGMLLKELWSCAQELAEHGATDEELERTRRAFERSRRDPHAVLGDLASTVEDELVDRPSLSVDELAAKIAAVGGAGIAGAMQALLERPILLGPGSSKPVGGLQEIPVLPAGEFEGERFQRPRPGRLKRRPDEELWVGERALGWRSEDERMTIAWEQVAVVEALLDGQLIVLAADGRWMKIPPVEWEDGARATALIRERVRAELVLPPADLALCTQIEAKVQWRIGDRALIAPQLETLPYELSPEEGVVDLAIAARLDNRAAGLLVVTGRRVLWMPTNGEEGLAFERGEVKAWADGGQLALVAADAEVHFAISPAGAAQELETHI